MDIRPHAVVDAPAAGSYTADLFTRTASAAGQSVQEFLEAGLAQGTLLKRLPTLSGIAETAAFLASGRAAAMTGTVVKPVRRRTRGPSSGTAEKEVTTSTPRKSDGA